MNIIPAFFVVLPIGLVFGGMFTIGIEGCFKRLLATLAISAVISGVITGLFVIEAKQDANVWNNGVCPDCSSEWRFVNANHLKHGGTIYYYTCDNCGRIIETNHSMEG